jgi:hypothetical protein
MTNIMNRSSRVRQGEHLDFWSEPLWSMSTRVLVLVPVRP